MPMSQEARRIYQDTLKSVPLLASTGVQKVDDIIRGVIGLYDRFFPNRIRSAYIRGSYASGFAVPTSDIDLELIWKDTPTDEEWVLNRQVRHLCELISPIEISVGLWDGPPDDSCFKFDCLCIYGEDVTNQMGAAPVEDYIRFSFGTQLMRDVRLWDLDTYPQDYPPRISDREERRILSAGMLVYPLDFPDPDGEFYGYNQRLNLSLYSEPEIGVKDLIQGIFECILPLAAQKVNRHIHNKEDAFQVFAKECQTEFSDFITEVWQVVRGEWHYRVPTNTTDRNRLRDLCSQFLNLENYYLTQFKQFWLEQIQSPSPTKWAYQPGDHRIYGLESLTEVLFPDQEIESILKPLSDETTDFGRACIKVITQLQEARQKHQTLEA